MKSRLDALLIVAVALTLSAQTTIAEDAKDAAIKNDRQQIHGTWRVVGLEIQGKAAKEEDARQLLVLNGSDGTWTLFSEGKEISKGTSSIDPTTTPKTIDFMPTDGAGSGKQFLGIYLLGEKTRKLCFAPKERGRPADFSSSAGSDIVLVTFKRERSE